MEIEHVLNKQEGKYLKLLLITFVQKISMIKDDLELEYSSNKMHLRLNYEKLLNQKILDYIDYIFKSNIVSLIAKLFSDYRKAQVKNKEAETDF